MKAYNPQPVEWLNEGDISHKHRFRRVHWDFALLGPDVIDMTEYFATYKYLEECSCKAKRIIARRNWK